MLGSLSHLAGLPAVSQLGNSHNTEGAHDHGGFFDPEKQEEARPLLGKGLTPASVSLLKRL